jgi:alanyl-tRNA synthetase
VNTAEIRAKYLSFFEEKGHLVVPSSSLVPRSDPTLLFTSAGMVQFKNYYLGIETPPNRRLASCQKSFRTTDIEAVGDTKHLTFFEMLGNFSIGEYFKKEAIGWAWEFIVERMKIPAERIWITVYTDDDEAFEIWNKQIGVPAHKITRFGAKENFWGPAGSSGPCGPCSELHYDFGEDCGCGKPDCNPGCGCDRFVELWNLVFTQFNQDESGVRTPLPRPNIDTGMGLERLSSIMQGKTTVYDTDIFAPLLTKVAALAGLKYGGNEQADHALRVVAEHSRAVSFLIADGVMPSNEGRGYVLRRLIRRAALFGRRVGFEKLFLADACLASIEHMKPVYPELEQRREIVLKVVEAEESRFRETLNTGLALLDNLIAETSSQVRKKVAGDAVFKLYDTYGFPVELTREMLSRAGLAADMEGFEVEMEKQRERARAAHKFDIAKGEGKKEIRTGLARSEFLGYRQLAAKTNLREIWIGGESVASARAGQEAALILDATPFYAEMGGQVGDTGSIGNSGGRFKVSNTIHQGEVSVHLGKVESGEINAGQEVQAAVDTARRLDIARNHTATHLLQYALREVLGAHVHQRGSQVGPWEFRFDFSHLTAMTADEQQRVQQIVNEKIRDNLIVNAEQMAYKAAVAEGATALFDEKYGDIVRVIKIGAPLISAELCGGTHVSATGQIGFFQIVAESSIGSGLRRIEAVTGKGAETLIEHNLGSLTKVAQSLGTSSAGVPDKIAGLLQELEAERRKLQTLEKDLSLKSAADLLNQVEVVQGVKVLAAQAPSMRLDSLREMIDAIKAKLGSAIVVLGTVYEDKPSFVAAVSPDLVQKGFNAGEIVKKVAQATGGGGGGKAGMAQAGGKDKTKIEEALRLVRSLIKAS